MSQITPYCITDLFNNNCVLRLDMIQERVESFLPSYPSNLQQEQMFVQLE